VLLFINKLKKAPTRIDKKKIILHRIFYKISKIDLI